jgi:hypothetical protein
MAPATLAGDDDDDEDEDDHSAAFPGSGAEQLKA